ESRDSITRPTARAGTGLPVSNVSFIRRRRYGSQDKYSFCTRTVPSSSPGSLSSITSRQSSVNVSPGRLASMTEIFFVFSVTTMSTCLSPDILHFSDSFAALCSAACEPPVPSRIYDNHTRTPGRFFHMEESPDLENYA